MMCNCVLIIDDDPDLRETMRDILEFEGLQAALAENGEQALDVLRHHPLPCMILLDLMMPVMNGWEFLDTLQSQHRQILEQTPVVVLSAIADLADVQQRYHCQVMSKPADVQSLITMARQYC